ncbi:TPA: hypothetical protein L9K64_004798 [Klebsiella variicola]|nr:hypothetical protein [Klebsiella variicola]
MIECKLPQLPEYYRYGVEEINTLPGDGDVFPPPGNIIKAVSLNKGVFVCVPVQRYIHGLNVWVTVESSS